MIASRGRLSMTHPRPLLPAKRPIRAALLALLGVVLLAPALGGCAHEVKPAGPDKTPAEMNQDCFIMPDGTALPYRAWLPPPGVATWAVVLALHGMNDSRDAWELSAPALARAGVAVYAPDQRGFGATDSRGYWPGTASLEGDARATAALVRARAPGAKFYLMGESMGAAVLMALAAGPHPPRADGWIFIAPAVWGRAEQTVFERVGLWLADHTVPGLHVETLPGVHVRASDNYAALVRLSRDPLTIHATRVDAVAGLVDLMDAALAASAHLHAPSLFLYGGHDQLVPRRATEAAWAALPRDGDTRIAYYPPGYHLLLRDEDRARRIRDLLAWMHDPAAPLPSGADRAAVAWLAAGAPAPKPGAPAGTQAGGAQTAGAREELPSAAVSGYASR